MSLEGLPRELLLMVTSYLPLTSIESLALTLNKQITATCLPELRPLFIRRRHEKRMISRFGDLYERDEYYHGIVEEHREKFGVPSEALLRMPTLTGLFQRLEYLELDETLHWLERLDRYTTKPMILRDRYRTLSKREVKELQTATEVADVTLPPSFLKLFTRLDLLHRIPSATICYFFIMGGLRKAPASIDGGAGGHYLTMYVDDEHRWTRLLYLEPGPEGAHCVLYLPEEFNWISDDESGAEVDDDSGAEVDDKNLPGPTRCEQASEELIENTKNKHIQVEGHSFEEWLVTAYFEQWISYARENPSEE